MFPFILLHRLKEENAPHRVRLDQILTYGPLKGSHGTWIKVKDDEQSLHVRESPEQLDKAFEVLEYQSPLSKWQRK